MFMQISRTEFEYHLRIHVVLDGLHYFHMFVLGDFLNGQILKESVCQDGLLRLLRVRSCNPVFAKAQIVYLIEVSKQSLKTEIDI